jgi:hypothetical protein
MSIQHGCSRSWAALLAAAVPAAAAEELRIGTVMVAAGTTEATLDVRATTNAGGIEGFIVAVEHDPAAARIVRLAPAGPWLAANPPAFVGVTGTSTHPGAPGASGLVVLMDLDGTGALDVIPPAPGGGAQVIARLDVEVLSGGGEPPVAIDFALADGAASMGDGPPLLNSLVIGGRDYVSLDAAFPLMLTSGRILFPGAFLRGDSTADGEVNITDPIRTLNSLFLGMGDLPCPDAADANDDAMVNITDPIFTLNYLFTGGSSPPAPGPDACGADPSEDGLGECANEECPVSP